MRRARRHEEGAKARAKVRKERAESLRAEAKQQEEVMATYYALLEVDDPDLAARISWTDDGKLFEGPVSHVRARTTSDTADFRYRASFNEGAPIETAGCNMKGPCEGPRLLRWNRNQEHLPQGLGR